MLTLGFRSRLPSQICVCFFLIWCVAVISHHCPPRFHRHCRSPSLLKTRKPSLLMWTMGSWGRTLTHYSCAEACFRSLQLLTKAPHPRCRGGICWVTGRPCWRHPHVRISIVAMVEFLHLCVRWLIRFVVQVQEIQWARAEQGVSAKGWSQSAAAEQFLQRCAKRSGSTLRGSGEQDRLWL